MDEEQSDVMMDDEQWEDVTEQGKCGIGTYHA